MNTTQCPRPGLEPEPLDPQSSALTMRPPRLPSTIENEAKKSADSHIAGSYTKEAHMIRPIYAPYNIVTCDIVYDASLIAFLLFLFENENVISRNFERRIPIFFSS